MTPADEDAHTASVLVRIYPAGGFGQVLVTVSDQGPITLTDAEIIRALRLAIEVVAERDSDRPPSLLRELAAEQDSGITEIEPGRFYADKGLPPVRRGLAP